MTLICGAGISGLLVGIELRKRGFPCRAVDPMIWFKRGKPCGDAVGERVADGSTEEFRSAVRESTISPFNRIVLQIAGAGSVEIDARGYIVDRLKLSRALLETFESYGGSIEREVCRDEDVARCENNVIVDATGHCSRIARFPAEKVVLYHVRARAKVGGWSERELVMFFDNDQTFRDKAGYAWLFVADDGYVNAGLHYSVCNDRDVCRRLIERLFGVELVRVYESNVHPISISSPPRDPVRRIGCVSVVAVGEAARAVNPVTGTGIPGAVLTAIKLGESYPRLELYSRWFRTRVHNVYSKLYKVAHRLRKMSNRDLYDVIKLLVKREFAEERTCPFKEVGILKALRYLRLLH